MVLEFIKKYVYQIAISLVAIFFIAPYLIEPAFSLLNDGWYIRLAQQAPLSDISAFLEYHGDRSIPFTLMFYIVVLRIVDFSPFGLVLYYLFELIFLLLFIYSFAGKGRSGFFASLIVLFSSAMATNIYEFFTQEHISLLLLFFFTGFYFQLTGQEFQSRVKKILYIVASSFLLILFFLTKEINFFLLGVFTVLFLYEWMTRKEKTVLYLLGLYMSISTAWLVYYFFSSANLQSAAGSTYSLSHIPHTLIGFIKILNVHWVPVVGSVIYFFIRVMRERWAYVRSLETQQIYFSLVAILSFVVYLPWNAAGRYALLPIVCFYIVFFSLIASILHKKIIASVLLVVFAGSIFFAAFDIVRFYGLRRGDANMLAYFKQHAEEYDQVCVYGGYAVAEDILEVEIWINDIYRLDKSVCTLAPVGDIAPVYQAVFDREGVVYGDNVKITSKTLVIRREFSHRESRPLPDQYVIEPKDTLLYAIYNIHPTRGFEQKVFNWHIGYLRKK